MAIDLATSVTAQLAAAASAVAGSWGLSDTLTVGEPTSAQPDLSFAGQAVLVEFSGRAAGRLALIVDDEIAQQLLDSPAAPPDLIAALSPAVTAACLAIGEVSIGSTTVVNPTSAVQQVLSLSDAASVTLTDEGEARAALVVGVAPPGSLAGSTSAAMRGAVPAQGRPVDPIEPPAHRLDLLRGVQMQATVELGRTQMTINDLLALRSGAVIELDRAAGAPADLYVNGRLIAHGEVVVVDENYGLRILQVVADETGR